MNKQGRYHGGLSLTHESNRRLYEYCRTVSATLEDYGHQITHTDVMEDDVVHLVTDRFTVNLALHRPALGEAHCAIGPIQPKGPSRLTIGLGATEAGNESPEHAQLMLVVVLYRLVQTYDAEYVEWMNPATRMPRRRFMNIFHRVSMERLHSVRAPSAPVSPRFAPVDETAHSITRRYDAISGQTAPSARDMVAAAAKSKTIAQALRKRTKKQAADMVAEQVVEEMNSKAAPQKPKREMPSAFGYLSSALSSTIAALRQSRNNTYRLTGRILTVAGLVLVLKTSGALASVLNRFSM